MATESARGARRSTEATPDQMAGVDVWWRAADYNMVMLNDLDRYRLATNVLDHVPGLTARHASLRQALHDARLRVREHTRERGTDIPAVADRRWPNPTTPATGKELQ